jgi:hypothetical protein
VKITPNQVFLHGYDRYEVDQEYDVSEGLGTYFVLNGWADSDEITSSGEEQPAEVTLDIHDVDRPTGSEVT